MPERLTELVNSLIEHSRAGVVPWSAGSVPNQYSVLVGDALITIAASMVRSGRPTGFDRSPEVRRVVMRAVSGDGVEVDRVGANAGEAHYESLDALWGLARRKALRVDETLQKISDAIRLGEFSSVENATDIPGDEPSKETVGS